MDLVLNLSLDGIRLIFDPVTQRLKVRIIIIKIMEIYKAPTLRLKALNKHTHIMYIEMKNVIQNK